MYFMMLVFLDKHANENRDGQSVSLRQILSMALSIQNTEVRSSLMQNLMTKHQLPNNFTAWYFF